MVDTAFDDFLDSEDDEFFLEASNQFLDYDLTTESIQSQEKTVSQKSSKPSTSSYFKSDDSSTSRETQNVSNTHKIFSRECEVALKHASSRTSLDSNLYHVSDCNKVPAGCVYTDKSILNKSKISLESNPNSNNDLYSQKSLSTSKECVTNITVDSSSIECTSVNNSIRHFASPDISYIDSRFTPGFTPKAKKRKLPGPAGFLELLNGSKESGSSEEIMDMEFENIVSSQFTPEHLSLISWQKLQTTVSSCPNLHSTVKYYSIKRVLQESSKKKLPKHMVVPFLCVLLRKLCYKESPTISVFMDDTGEINGKIDAEVLSTYKEYLVEGTALILKNVTFLCNILILKTQNLVSMYHPDGKEKHPQTLLDSILKTSEPLKPMNCEFLKPSHNSEKCNSNEFPLYNTLNNRKSDCISHSQIGLNTNSDKSKTFPKTTCCNKTPELHKSGDVGYNQNRLSAVSNQNMVTKNYTSHLSLKRSPHANEVPSSNKSMRSDAFIENLLDEDNCIDEFDELLGNLDEKSFMD